VKIAVTGRPGIGKTTLCMKVFKSLDGVEGFVTLEVREKDRRIGFKLHDLKSGEELWLAKVGEGYPKVGKYVVFLESIDRFAERLRGYNGNLVIVDEVGPMELKSDAFVKAMEELVESPKNLLVTVHYRSRHPLVERIKREFELYVIDERNRDEVAEEIIKKFKKLKSKM
jgi:nucleoside-triphosphatase